MDLIIIDHYGKERLYPNAPVIPRVGERIAWSYDPAPRVEDVLYLLDDNKVIVKLA